MSLDRRSFLIGLGATAALAASRSSRSESAGPAKRMPVLFAGHGSPMNAIEDNRYGRAWRAMGQALPRPRAILTISAHWLAESSDLTGDERPRTLHDFGGFPRALHEVQYPAPGAPELAKELAERLGGRVRLDWGLDHGTWSVLRHAFPHADVPVLQLAIAEGLSDARHFELGRRLAPLRNEGVLIVGSGNVTHDLRDVARRRRSGDLRTPDWSRRFDEAVVQALEDGDADALVALSEHRDFDSAHPTTEHWLPILYAAGASLGDGGATETASYPVEGFALGSLSMRSVRFG